MEFKKGNHYIVEWIDPVCFEGEEQICEDKLPNFVTYGQCVGKSDSAVFLLVESEKGSPSNVVKIPTKCLMSIQETDKKLGLTLPIVLVLIGACSLAALYFSFQPTKTAIGKVIDTIISNQTIEIN